MDTRSISSTGRLLIFIVVLGILSSLAGLYAEWLWFDSVKFGQVFSTILFSKVALYLLLFVVGFLFFFVNLQITRKNMGLRDREHATDDGREIIYLDQERPSPWRQFMRGGASRWFFIAASLVGGFLVSSASTGKWIIVQQYLNRVAVGTVDPVFGKDLGFYFFNLSFYQFIYGTLMMTLVLTLLAVGVIYALNASSDLIFGDWRQFTVAKSHLAVLVALILGLKAWGYRLASYDILFSPTGIVYGANYTDLNARLIAYKALLAISLVVAVVILINIFIKRSNWIFISIGAWIVIAILMGGIYPAVIQKIVVQPNEYNKEKLYIERAIEYTRSAYNLDRADIKSFDVDYNLNVHDPDHKDTIDNIRLWDWQPLTVTYKNLQQLRPYYVFNDVDVDRYTVDGQYRQVMVSVREIDQEELPVDAKTWINQRLFYTHGYGMVASPVNEIEEEGFPRFFIKDIPPRYTADLEVTRPQVYFGESTNSYAIVNTKQKEYDYPLGDKNVYNTYEGQGGIKINSFGRKLLFSWALKDYKLMISSLVTNDSQILMNRNIMTRVEKVAPYLGFDGDPYIVLNDDGRLYWMIDAYTYTDKYPYSTPFSDAGYNYLRNAVKITIDAYTGEMNFYIAEANDPIIKAYSSIFPDMYKALSEMPAGLQSHVRYPVDLFMVQANMYRTFHMTDTNVFYNKEDPWLIPKEVVENKKQDMEPYYIIMRLPGEEKAEYVLMLPFTPKSRPNMVGWMCARMDGDNYGKMLVYNFPKQETIYGPEQVEARINQDTVISQQLSLWDQRGSNVYRGNLLVIPMGNSILYVEPLYLQAESSQLPELKRVIAGYGNKIVMEPTLDQALVRLFGEGAVPAPETPGIDDTPAAAEGQTVQELARQAREYYDQAQTSLKEGDWNGYGQNLEKLNQVLQLLEETSGQ